MKRVTNVCVLSDSESSTGSNTKTMAAPVSAVKDSACSSATLPSQFPPNRQPPPKRYSAATVAGANGEKHDFVGSRPSAPLLPPPLVRPSSGASGVNYAPVPPLRYVTADASDNGVALARRIGQLLRYSPYMREREQPRNAVRVGRDNHDAPGRITMDLLSRMGRDNDGGVPRQPAARENVADHGTYAEWGASIRLGIGDAMELDLDLKL